jgi:hypothetical protein
MAEQRKASVKQKNLEYLLAEKEWTVPNYLVKFKILKQL